MKCFTVGKYTLVNNVEEKIISNIAPQLKDNIQNWFLKRPNDIDSMEIIIFKLVKDDSQTNVIYSKIITNTC